MSTTPAVCATQSACQMIEREAGRQGMSAFELSKRSGVSRSYICRVFNEASTPRGMQVSLELLERLAQAMGVRLTVTGDSTP